MAGFIQTLPEWNKAGVGPTTPKRSEGWQVDEHPPAEWFNWQWNLTYLALQELQQSAAHRDGSGAFSGPIKSDVASGTAPFIVASGTVVTNLNADRVDNYHAAQTSTVSTLATRDSAGDLTSRRFISDVATGTPPLQVASTTFIPNLNADRVDDLHAIQGATANSIAARDNQADITTRRFISNVATGTAPFVVTSTTVVTNLNADQVDGYHAAEASTPSTVAVRKSDGYLQSVGFVSTATEGTTPLYVASSTVVSKLNADMVDGLHASASTSNSTVAARTTTGNLNANAFISDAAPGNVPFVVTSTAVVPNLNVDMVDGFHLNQDVRTTASPSFVKATAATFQSTQATGTAPLTVASQTLVTNLNADLLDGFHAVTASSADTIALRDSGGDIFANRFRSSVATGTAPLTITSSTVVPNLNVDMVDGFHLNQDVRTTASPSFAGLNLTGVVGATLKKAVDTNASYINFKNVAGTEIAWVGYGTVSDNKFSIRNTLGAIDLSSSFGVTINGGTVPVNDGNLSTNLNAEMVGGWKASQASAINTVAVRDSAGDITSRRFVSNVATGIAPMAVTSTSVVLNLNADLLDGMHASTAATANTVANRDENGDFAVRRIIFSATGSTAPFTVANTTVVTNLNADMVDGYHVETVGTVANSIPYRDGNAVVSANRFNSLIATGTSPFTVQSTTVVTNLNADMLDGLHASGFLKGSGTNTTSQFEFSDTSGNIAVWFRPNNAAYTLSMRNMQSDATDVLRIRNGADTLTAFSVRGDGSGTFSNNLSARQFQSIVATGTAPLQVSSTTLVANLNADMVDGFDAATTATANTVAVRDASTDLTARRFISIAVTGTAPFQVSSPTVVTSLNADMVDGYHAATAATGNTAAVRDGLGDLTIRRMISNVAAGTAPIQVASNTMVANLNADMVDGIHGNELSRSRTKALEVVAGTAETTIAGFTPATAGNYMVLVYLRVISAATTVTLKVTYADVGGAQTLIPPGLDGESFAIGSYSVVPMYINVVSGTPIQVKATAGADFRVMASAVIMEV